MAIYIIDRNKEFWHKRRDIGIQNTLLKILNSKTKTQKLTCYYSKVKTQKSKLTCYYLKVKMHNSKVIKTQNA